MSAPSQRITSAFWARRCSSDAGSEAADQRGTRGALLTERAWRRLFDGDRSVLGRTLTIDEQAVVIVGIQSVPLESASDPDVFIALDTGSPEFRDRSRRVVDAIGRLRPGVTAAAAQAEMEAIGERIAHAYPEGRAGHKVYVRDLKTFSTGFNWRPLYFFLYAAGLVMLLTCVNVAGLVLARALRRGHEFALRGALGGGRGALARQLLVEGALLALPGGALGLLLTTWALGVLSRFIPPDMLQRGNHVPVDARVCLAAFALAGLTAIVFGLVPHLFRAPRGPEPDSRPGRPDHRAIARAGARPASVAGRTSRRDGRPRRDRGSLPQELHRPHADPDRFRFREP